MCVSLTTIVFFSPLASISVAIWCCFLTCSNVLYFYVYRWLLLFPVDCHDVCLSNFYFQSIFLASYRLSVSQSSFKSVVLKPSSLELYGAPLNGFREVHEVGNRIGIKHLKNTHTHIKNCRPSFFSLAEYS